MAFRGIRVAMKDRSGLYTARNMENRAGEDVSMQELSDNWFEAFDDTFEDWSEFVDRFGPRPSDEDLHHIMRNFEGMEGYGYVRTSNSFNINEKLYNPENDGKSDEEIFTRRDRNGVLRDLETVRSLDRAINNGRVPSNAVYTRFAGTEAIKNLFGLSNDQMNALKNASALTAAGREQLSKVFKGSRSYSKSYTSSSANRTMNVFTNKPVERRLYVPAGMKAYAVSRNASESEVIFGRGLQTEIVGISVNGRGNVVLHERVIGYKRR